ncbi:VENN motif pre-toxin domain-containing protein [Pantoea ananatis]|uniref:VENN motif pre-toxin domain-containing protein n=1 Tax=Pantoea ananas TaxID=553 RepID=UPI003F66381C
MHSNFDSVKEQSGLYAGNGGFDVTVGNHAQLNGAVIVSQADADKNRLDTGTLGFTDLHNEADYKTEHQGIGMSSGASLGGQFAGNMANTMLAGAGGKGHAEGTTQSAVSDGTIVVRDQANQKQDTATLSRDTAHANDSISPIFNKEKEQQRLQTAQMIGEIGSQVGDIVKTQGAIEATRAANNDMKQVSPEKLQQAKKDWEEANPGKTPTSEQISKQAWQSYYDSALSASPYAVGGSVQRIVTAATAAVQGLASGDIRAAAGGAAPYIANLIGHSDLDPASRLMAHAVVNAALAAAQDKNIAAGAAGAVTGELTGMLASEIYGKKPYEMNDREKETVSALATLAAGLSGGLAGSGAADMVAAAQAGKVTVENNYLSQKQQAQKDKEIAECQTVACKAGAQAKWTAIDLGQDGSFAAGMVAGVPAGLYDAVDSIVKTASSPVETYEALKTLFNSGDVLGNVSDAVKQSYIDRIDRMEAEYQKAGASGSFNAGVEGGKLVTDIAGLLAGGAGVVKGGAVLTEKVVAKTTGIVDTALKSSVINKILEADRIGSGLKPDPTHRGASYLSREQLMDGKVFNIKGGDGIERKLLQAEGSFNEKKGIFEYIYDNKGNVTHQRFIEGGSITGAPNQRLPKVK